MGGGEFNVLMANVDGYDCVSVDCFMRNRSKPDTDGESGQLEREICFDVGFLVGNPENRLSWSRAQVRKCSRVRSKMAAHGQLWLFF